MDYLSRVWEQLAGRLEGPFVFRFVLQPLVATILAIRAGVADAQDHRAPYLWSVLSDPVERPQLMRDGWKDVTRVFVFGIVMDVLYQLIVFGNKETIPVSDINRFMASFKVAKPRDTTTLNIEGAPEKGKR